ncbi:ATP synthase F1 subunit delta [Aquiflexum sp. TKW24L]|uniref:ATP synthase F1 subunit delta n=1 Tax=Aquiflexum sp. TKW24L TaxID=2942212 RepID=UPI0020BF3943|nr:ATP synthase F1 subunit delta [Aquiflexum sp. TKW24L]MCL6258480.1 ATP synthase F1 subunit delta [Aquiflexum sp. TKW24L]
MSQIKVATRYAKAILDLAIERNVLDAVVGDMKGLLSIAAQNRGFGLALANPIITFDKKFNILKALLGKSANEISMTFFDLVTRKNRSSALISTAQEFLRQYNEHKGIQVAEVTTTIPLTAILRKQFEEIVKEISGLQKVELVEKIDKNLIGGFILKVNDKQLDDSISGKLRNMRMKFNQRYFVKLY